MRNSCLKAVLLAPLAALALNGCGNKAEGTASTGAGLGGAQGVKQLMTTRGLSEADVEAALLTYRPSGKKDDYVI
ncbi:MAG: hypothetical protein WBV82_26860, partial [Myxococcaceae bacterium]